MKYGDLRDKLKPFGVREMKWESSCARVLLQDGKDGKGPQYTLAIKSAEGDATEIFEPTVAQVLARFSISRSQLDQGHA